MSVEDLQDHEDALRLDRVQNLHLRAETEVQLDSEGGDLIQHGDLLRHLRQDLVLLVQYLSTHRSTQA